MRGEESVAVPHNTDSNVGEVGVDDVPKVAWGSDEGIHNSVDLWAGADVLAELLPVMGNARADGVCMADETAIGTVSSLLLGGPSASEAPQLGVQDERGQPFVGTNLVDLVDERRLVADNLRGRWS